MTFVGGMFTAVMSGDAVDVMTGNTTSEDICWWNVHCYHDWGC